MKLQLTMSSIKEIKEVPDEMDVIQDNNTKHDDYAAKNIRRKVNRPKANGRCSYCDKELVDPLPTQIYCNGECATKDSK